MVDIQEKYENLLEKANYVPLDEFVEFLGKVFEVSDKELDEFEDKAHGLLLDVVYKLSNDYGT